MMPNNLQPSQHQSDTNTLCTYGLPTIDAFTNGLCKGDLAILSAHSYKEKSNFGYKVAVNAAMNGSNVLILCLTDDSTWEMAVYEIHNILTKHQFPCRKDMVQGFVQVNTDDVKAGQIYIPKPSFTLGEGKHFTPSINQVFNLVKMQNIDLVIIDTPLELSKEKDAQTVLSNMRKLKEGAVSTGCALLCLVNAHTEYKLKPYAGESPLLLAPSDVSKVIYSKQITSLADVVLYMYHSFPPSASLIPTIQQGNTECVRGTIHLEILKNLRNPLKAVTSNRGYWTLYEHSKLHLQQVNPLRITLPLTEYCYVDFLLIEEIVSPPAVVNNRMNNHTVAPPIQKGVENVVLETRSTHRQFFKS